MLARAIIPIARRFGYYGAVATYRPPALTAGVRAGTMVLNVASVTMAIILPMREPERRLLQAIGGERSSRMGYAAAGTDIRQGDEVRYGTIVMAVDGIEQTPDMVMCALSEIRPRGGAVA